MANYKLVQNQISRGRGKAARVVGQPFTVTRLTQEGFKLLYPDYRCLLRKITSHPYLEQRFFTSQLYELVSDCRKLQIGDMITELQGAYLSQSIVEAVVRDKDIAISSIGDVLQKVSPTYVFIGNRPIRKFIAARMDQFCQVRRGFYSYEDGDGTWQQQGENAEYVLTLPDASQTFQWSAVNESGYPPEESRGISPAPVPVLIPFQFEPAYARAQPPADLPMDWGVNKWHFMCPGNWSNFSLRENDIIISPQGHRMRVHVIWPNVIGPMVQQGMVEKLES